MYQTNTFSQPNTAQHKPSATPPTHFDDGKSSPSNSISLSIQAGSHTTDSFRNCSLTHPSLLHSIELFRRSVAEQDKRRNTAAAACCVLPCHYPESQYCEVNIFLHITYILNKVSSYINRYQGYIRIAEVRS